MDTFGSMTPALPEIFIALSACIVLMAGVLLPTKPATTTANSGVSWAYNLAIAGSLLTLFTVVLSPALLDSTFFNHYRYDGLARLIKSLALGFLVLGLIYMRPYLRRHRIDCPEYYTLALFATLGVMIMASAGSLLILYLGVELLALCLYGMVAIDRQDDRAAEAAMKYFVLGAIASGALLYGMSMFYGLTGSLHLSELVIDLSDPAPANIAQLALAFVLVGIAFKLGAVPFHAWMPDVYQGGPTATALFISSIAKLAAFALLARLLLDGLFSLHSYWQTVLVGLGIVSLIYGNLLALRQIDIKRLLAFST
ncbi:MAG: NADH-quinone oxidoreductase subunit N, partial [Gammaproteobacteria bacterium]|nr:NADH-quinone oxidoreductase subunit N [Gammaproteobacteria bacterium]